MNETYDKYTEYIINEMIDRTDINSVDMIHDQILPPWVKEVNILPNLLEYDEWIMDWGDQEFNIKPVVSLEKHKRMWNNTITYFYTCADNFLHENYGVPEHMRRMISEKYRKRLREMIDYHRIVK